MVNPRTGAFGEVTCDFATGIATKETYRLEIKKSNEPISLTERLYRERVMDATAVSHSFILETYSVEHRTDQAPVSGYDNGLRIQMPLCKLLYAESSDEKDKDRAPTIEELAKRYIFPQDKSAQDQRTNPAYIAWVFETVMNVGEAIAYLHDKGRYHGDLHLLNILVDTQQHRLGNDVTELADKVRVYVADMLGKDRQEFLDACEKKPGGTYSEMESEPIKRSRMVGEITYIKISDPDDKEEVAKAYARGDIKMLGAMAAWMLAGTEQNSMDDAIYKDPQNRGVSYYCNKNSGLKSMENIIHAIRNTGALGVGSDEYTSSYNSMREFLDKLKGELEKYFYTTERKNLPKEVQERVGTTEGWIVRTPTMFYSLMYAGRKYVTSDEIKIIEKNTLVIRKATKKEFYGAHQSISIPQESIESTIEQSVIETVEAEITLRINEQETDEKRVLDIEEKAILALATSVEKRKKKIEKFAKRREARKG